MPIITCKQCGRPSRFADSDVSIRCPHCQAAIETTLSAPSTPASDALLPKPKSPFRPASLPASAAIEPATPVAAVAETAAPNLSPKASESSNPTETASSTVAARQLLPPKHIDKSFLQRLLPPKFNSGHRGSNFAGDRQTKGKILIPNGQGGFTEVDEQIVHVKSNGERIPIELTDRRTQWRQRAIFNLIAMVVCLAILYLSFLFIVPR